MIARHAEMFRELSVRSKEVDKFEKKVRSYQSDVRAYDCEIKQYNAARLKELGGVAGTLKSVSTTTATTTTTTTTFEQLPQSTRKKAVASNNKIGLVGDIRPVDNQPFAASLTPLLSPSEAAALIKMSEQIGYRSIVKNISTNYDQSLPERTNIRCVVHSKELADYLWPLVRECVPKVYRDRNDDQWMLKGINECFRFCKYDTGQLFAAHVDDVYATRDLSERSFVTVVLYLNEGYDGGKLRFLQNKWPTTSGSGGGAQKGTWEQEAKAEQKQDENILMEITPTAGMCMMFQHNLLHEATPPSGGIPKYLVRTDIVYAKKNRR